MIIARHQDDTMLQKTNKNITPLVLASRDHLPDVNIVAVSHLFLKTGLFSKPRELHLEDNCFFSLVFLFSIVGAKHMLSLTLL